MALSPGLYQGSWLNASDDPAGVGYGDPTVYVVEGGTKRGVVSTDALFQEFGDNAWFAIQRDTSAAELAAIPTVGSIANPPRRAIPGVGSVALSTQVLNNVATQTNFLGLPVTGGGTIGFGNQSIPGNIWLWLVLVGLIIFLLARRS